MFIIYSIFIYSIVFTFSLLFSSYADKALKKSHGAKFILCSIISVTLPCTLACLRGINVGTDTINYINTYIGLKKSSNLTNLFLWGEQQNIEEGYTVFIYILGKLNCSIHVFLFLLEMLSVLPVYIACVKLRKQLPIHIGMAVFFALFYNITYNASRQCIALAFMLIAYCELREKKVGSGVLLCILSILFHKSAFIGFAFIACGLVFENIKANIKRQLCIILILCAVALFPLYFDKLFDLLCTLGILRNQNTIYGKIFSFAGDVKDFTGFGKGAFFSIIIRLILFMLPLIFHLNDHLLRKNKIVRASFIITFIGVILYANMSIVFRSIHVYRITLYAEYFFIIYFPSLYKTDKRIGLYKMPLQNILFYGNLYMYWIITFILWNAHETNNYFMIGA